MPNGNLMIVQGGGPTAVLNASLSAAIAAAQPAFQKIYGASFGTQGLARNEILDLTNLSPEVLHRLAHSPGAALGTSRFKPTSEDNERIVANLRRLGVTALLFMGGNGTQRGGSLIAQLCAHAGFDVQIIGVPKTIDNDLALTDRCPGHASAARFVAQSTVDLGMDNRSLRQPVSVLEVMGRNVGWLAAASTLAKLHPDDAPHLVYLPELPFDTDRFLAALDSTVSRLGRAIVVVAEGIRYADGTPVFQQPDPSQPDPTQRPLISGVGQHLADLAGHALRLRCRAEKPGLLGRASASLASTQDRQDASLVGREAVAALLAGHTNQMVALHPLTPTGEATTHLVPIAGVAGHERTLPADWLDPGPLAVNDLYRAYAHPLAGPIDHYLAPLDTLS